MFILLWCASNPETSAEAGCFDPAHVFVACITEQYITVLFGARSVVTVRACRYVLLDRDGVLNEDRPDSVRRPAQLHVLPGVKRAVRWLNETGFGVIVVTNQACVGRGEVSQTSLDAIHEKLTAVIGEGGGRIERIYVCPHREEDACQCRKPLPGLLHRAQRDYGMNLSQTWFVGDSLSDVEVAMAAGCRPALVLTGKPVTRHRLGVVIFANLLDFAGHLASAEGLFGGFR